jgi:RNA polymerase sigma-70 factor (ECF subfamily)
LHKGVKIEENRPRQYLELLPSCSERSNSMNKSFATTHWSLVLAAGKGASADTQAALEALCQTYWYPLYAYVRRHGYQPDDAQDLTQEFFAPCLRSITCKLPTPSEAGFAPFC